MTVTSKIDSAQITSVSKAGLTIFENFVPLDTEKVSIVHTCTNRCS